MGKLHASSDGLRTKPISSQSDHGASKELANPLPDPERIIRFFWCTLIQVIKNFSNPRYTVPLLSNKSSIDENIPKSKQFCFSRNEKELERVNTLCFPSNFSWA